MNAGTVSRVLSLIPDRSARVQSGVTFLPEASSTQYPERLAYLTKFLSWLSPLNALGKDDQRALGLVAANGRPVQVSATEEDADEQDAEDHELDMEPLGAEPEDDETEDAETEEAEAEEAEADDTEPLDAWAPEPAAPSGVVQHAAGEEDLLDGFDRL